VTRRRKGERQENKIIAERCLRARAFILLVAVEKDGMVREVQVFQQSFSISKKMKSLKKDY
jgi:hypothetical protein